MANTAPDVNLDEILQALDADTQAYLRLLLVGAGQGLKGRDRDLGELLGGLGPINRDFRKLNVEVAKRKENLRRLVHNLGELTNRIGQADSDIISFITASNSALGAINESELADGSVRRAVRLLGPTLQQARVAFTETSAFAAELGPAFEELRPFARNLEGMNASLQRLGEAGTPALRNQIRPFVRDAQPLLPDLRRAAERYSKAAPRLTVIGKKVNRLGNMAAHNPNGAEGASVADLDRDEGYLYWAAWLARSGNSVFSASDGNGPWRRIYLSQSCANIAAIVGSSPLAPAVTGLAPVLGALC
jgi:ABC-type transporter Mla subunit MlaD